MTQTRFEFGEPQPLLPHSDDSETAKKMQDTFRRELRAGTNCPCCGQFAKIYKRKFNSGMARSIISFYKKSLWKQGWIHVLKEMDFGKRKGKFYVNGDYGNLTAWELIEAKKEVAEDGNPSSGYYRITDVGKQFACGQIQIPKYTYHYNGEVLDRGSEEVVTIYQALGDKFNYQELMSA